MTDDLVKQLRWLGDHASFEPHMHHTAADRIETLESVMRDDARWLAAYHKWCEMNGCAPSSSDLIAARETLKALKTKD